MALADLDKAAELRPGYGSIRKFRGYVLDALSRKEESQASMESAKNLYPTAAEDLYWLGVFAHSKEFDNVAAYDYFSRALLLSPNDYWSRIELAYFGRILSENGAARDQRVMTELDIAKTLRPDLPFASEVLSLFFSSEPARRKKELEEQINRFGLYVLRAHSLAECFEHDKRYDEARNILQNVLEQDAGGVTAERLGDLEYRVGRYEQARDWYQRAISQGTKYPTICLSLANAFSAMQDWPNAEKAYKFGIDQNPQAAWLYWALGSWFEARGRTSDAEKIYRTGCELPDEVEGSPQSSDQVRNIAQCFQNLAFLQVKAGLYAESRQVLQKGIARLENAEATAKRDQSLRYSRLDYEIIRLKELLAKSDIASGRIDNALSLIDDELKRKPITLLRAQVLVELLRLHGQEQSALDVARLAESTAKDSPAVKDESVVAHGLVDTQLVRMGLYKELFSRLETRLALGKELSAGEYAWFVSHPGPEALTILAEGVTKYPDSVGLHMNYMQSLAKAGQKSKAWEAYKKSTELYFTELDRSVIPRKLLLGERVEVRPPPPSAIALPWYTFLLQEGNDEELGRLEDRLKRACDQTNTDAKTLTVPRSTAEFSAGRFAAAAKSFEICVEKKLWKEITSEAVITAGLAKSLRAVGQREKAIEAYRRAVELSRLDPALHSEFLCLVLEVQGIPGLLKELPTFAKFRPSPDVRINAILSSFDAWVFAGAGNEKVASEHLGASRAYVNMAIQQSAFGMDERLVCGVIFQVVSEKLRYPQNPTGFMEFLKTYPADRVKAVQELFALPIRK